MSAFQSRYTNGLHSTSQRRAEGCFCSCNGLAATEVLCIKALIFPYWKPALPRLQLGQRGTCSPCPKCLCSASSSGLLGDRVWCWPCTVRTCTVLAEAALLTDHFCTRGGPFVMKGTFLTPMKHSCLPKTLWLVELGSQTWFAWVLHVPALAKAAALQLQAVWRTSVRRAVFSFLPVVGYTPQLPAPPPPQMAQTTLTGFPVVLVIHVANIKPG